jgi:tetratricopeptide (TPR) repeat protein
MNKEADDSFEEQEIDEAIIRYEEMLANGKRLYFDVYQFEHIIDFYLDEDQVEAAFDAVELGLSMHTSSSALLLKKAGILLNMGEVETAHTIANQLLQIEETNFELHLINGTALLLKGLDNEAAKAFNLALRHTIDERDETLFSIGFAYEQADQVQKAISFFEEANKINPKNEAVIYELGFCYERINDDLKSIKFYDDYLDLDTFSDSAWFNMGIVYTKLKIFDKAIEAYEYALAINETFSNAWFNMGYTYWLWKKFKKAIDSFIAFSQFDPENDEIYCMIAECYLKMHKNKKASHYYSKALAINENNANAMHGLGFILHAEGKPQKAHTLLKKAVKIESDNGDFWYTYAKVCAQINLFHDSVMAFEVAAELFPENDNIWLSHAALLHKRGEVLQAIDLLYSALEHQPENPTINYRLAAYLLESGEEVETTATFEKALSLDYDNYSQLFDSFPEARNSETINNLIKIYKKINL